jgi:beta-lactamase class A
VRRRAAAALALAGAFGALGPATAAPSDRALVDAGRLLLPVAEAAAEEAASDVGATQAAYDRARDLQEAVRAAGPVSAACRPLLRALGRYAAARVRQMEGVDRPSASDVAAGRRAAERARAAARAAGPRCPGTGAGTVAAALGMSPSDGEVFFGPVVARAPRGAETARLTVDGEEAGEAAVRGGRARFGPDVAPGRHRLRVTFLRGGRTLGVAVAAGAWRLPASARRAVPGARTDPDMAAALGAALRSGPAYRAAWVQDLTTGASAGVGAGASFPAASTVKLGLLAGALARLGARPERRPEAYDLRAMAGFSSNLATNRLLERLGGAATAADGLRRLGAARSTFPGGYLVGFELQPALPAAGPGTAPPRTSGRVTTARDLARMLFSLHAAAVGAPGARRETGLTAHQARLALGWLLSSEQRGDNAGLLAGGVPEGTPIAQKNGWLDAARHAAGILYLPEGPRIAVVLSYDARGVSLDAARRLGARVASVKPAARP